MPLSVHNRRPNFWYFHKEISNNKELIELYISMIIRTLAFSMIGIFVPIYLLTKGGLSLEQTIIFFIIWATGMATLYPVGGWLSARVGYKHTMLLSTPVYILYFILLLLMPTHNINYIIISLVSALANGMFWMAYHSHFTQITDRKKRGEETSITFAIILGAGILGPFIGGLIITYLGFVTQFVVSTLLLIASTVPLFFTKDHKGMLDIKFKYIFRKDHLKDFIRSILIGARFMTEGIIWPIFLFIAIKEFLEIGAVSSIAALLGAISAIIIGKISDKYSKKRLIRIGGVFDAAIWSIRGLITSLGGFIVTTSLGAILFKIVEVPYDARIYNKAARGNIIGYLMMREMGIGIGRVLILILALIISIKGSIFATAGISLLHLLL